jgi:ADP-heptose:LPS heptosyltransferase
VEQFNFQESSSLASLWKLLALRCRRYDVTLAAFPANRFEYNLAQWIIGAPRRYGHNYIRGRNSTYLRWLLTDRVEQRLGTHVVDENLKVVGRLTGAQVNAEIDRSLGPLKRQHHAFADAVVAAFGTRLLGIHAGCNTYKNQHRRRWPPDRFAELCSRVKGELGLTPLLFGGAADRSVNEAIKNGCAIATLVETPTIRDTAAVMQRCAAFVSNDSALGHLAGALDVPAVMIVGPTDPAEIGALGSVSRTVAASLPCAPCFRVSRRPLSCSHAIPFACTLSISVDTVFTEIASVLCARQASHTTAEEARNMPEKQRLCIQ